MYQRSLPRSVPFAATTRTVVAALMALAVLLGAAGASHATTTISPSNGRAIGGEIVSGTVAIPDFRQSASGLFHSVGLGTDGTVWSWGDNAFGQLGNGTTTRASTPVPVTPSWPAGVTITSVAAFVNHSLALASDGTVWAWGYNQYGQLGTGTTARALTPVPVTQSWPAGVTITQIATSNINAMALGSDGSVWTWGDNERGQLGDGTTTNALVPVRVTQSWPAGVTITRVSAGTYHSLAIASDGSVWAWGDNFYGQLGNSTTNRQLMPVRVTPSWPAGATITGITAGGYHSFATASDGSFWAWGRNSEGQLGNGTTTQRVVTPVPVTQSWPAGATVTATAGGDNHSLVVVSDGSVWAWGNNSRGCPYVFRQGSGRVFFKF